MLSQKSKRLLVFFAIALVIVLITSLWSIFQNPAAQVTLRFTEDEQATRDEYFVDNEIVLSGPVDQVNEIVAQINLTSDVELLLVGSESFRLAEDISGQEDSSISSNRISSKQINQAANCQVVYEDRVINLYRFERSDRTEIEEILDLIDQISADNAALANVNADPNWIIGTPWSPTGSPWSPTGSSSGGLPQIASPVDFENQWAFNQVGLNEIENSDLLELPQIKIGVFDTSAMEASSIETEDLTDPISGIEFFHPNFIQMPPPPDPSSGRNINVANHGYFGTGFIQKLAPNSDIQIIRVLTPYNRGDLFTLNRELLKFMVSNSQATPAPIINMSLGIPHLFEIEGDELPFDFNRNFRTLGDIMEFAECLQIVVVAASGNESANRTPLPPDFPAAWESVLGVTASTLELKQSCYANNGDVAAPGGDGGLDEETQDPCAPILDSCTGPNCNFGVIGLVHPNVNRDGFHYWVGTSFATPMVTGLAALVRQVYPNISAADVRSAIVCGSIQNPESQAQEEVNIIHLASTFECINEIGLVNQSEFFLIQP